MALPKAPNKLLQLRKTNPQGLYLILEQLDEKGLKKICSLEEMKSLCDDRVVWETLWRRKFGGQLPPGNSFEVYIERVYLEPIAKEIEENRKDLEIEEFKGKSHEEILKFLQDFMTYGKSSKLNEDLEDQIYDMRIKAFKKMSKFYLFALIYGLPISSEEWGDIIMTYKEWARRILLELTKEELMWSIDELSFIQISELPLEQENCNEELVLQMFDLKIEMADKDYESEIENILRLMTSTKCKHLELAIDQKLRNFYRSKLVEEKEWLLLKKAQYYLKRMNLRKVKEIARLIPLRHMLLYVPQINDHELILEELREIPNYDLIADLGGLLMARKYADVISVAESLVLSREEWDRLLRYFLRSL